MRYVEAPAIRSAGDHEPSVFIAGGITGTEQGWQRNAAQLLDDLDVTVFNPRWQNFPCDDDSAHERQVRWENRYLHEKEHRVSIVAFWFPASANPTVQQPIALLELGRLLERGTPIAVGVSEGYLRRRDVLVQVGLARPEITVRNTLEDTMKDVRCLLMAL